MYLLKSRISPAPIDWPDRLVPPPRGMIARPCFGGRLHGGNHVVARARQDDAHGHDLVDAGIGAVQSPRVLVEKTSPAKRFLRDFTNCDDCAGVRFMSVTIL